jgi:hypothetical protein
VVDPRRGFPCFHPYPHGRFSRPGCEGRSRFGPKQAEPAELKNAAPRARARAPPQKELGQRGPNYGNFNLSHMILSRRKLMGGGRRDLQNSWEVGGVICKGVFANHSSHLLLSALLEQHCAAHIEVFIICTKRLVFT